MAASIEFQRRTFGIDKKDLTGIRNILQEHLHLKGFETVEKVVIIGKPLEANFRFQQGVDLFQPTGMLLQEPLKGPGKGGIPTDK